MSEKANQKLSTKPTNGETRAQLNSSKPNDKPGGSSKPIDQLAELEERARFSSDEESDHEMDSEILVEQDYHSSDEDQPDNEEVEFIRHRHRDPIEVPEGEELDEADVDDVLLFLTFMDVMLNEGVLRNRVRGEEERANEEI